MGTIKNAVYKLDNGTDFDEIHFKTKAAQVFCNDGKTVESQLAEKANQITLDTTNSNVAVLQKRSAIISSRVINTNGTQSFTLGFKPRIVRIHATLKNSPMYDSEGSYSGNGYATMYRYGNGTLVGNSDTLGVICLHSGTAYNKATCAFTDTGFNLVWEVFGSLPADTILMTIEALG